MEASGMKMRGTEARNFALIVGIFFTVIGILGFVPGLVATNVPQPDPKLIVDTGYGYLMGLFPVNILHNIAHLGVGLWGVAASRSSKTSLIYCQGFAILYSLIAVMGLIPVLSTTFGLMPVFGHNVWLNLITAAIASYYGFVAVPGVETAVREEKHNRSGQVIER